MNRLRLGACNPRTMVMTPE